MNDYKLTWVGINRVFRVAHNLVRQGGELSRLDKNTYVYLFNQLSDVEKDHIIRNFGDTLTFLRI